MKSLPQVFKAHPVSIRHGWKIGDLDSQEQYPFMQHLVVFEVMQQGRWSEVG